MGNSPNLASHQIGLLSFAKDPPNICSLAGLLCAVLGIYFAIFGNFPAAIIGMIWVVLFDWGDGIIARKMKGRTDVHRDFGGQLDSLIDMVESTRYVMHFKTNQFSRKDYLELFDEISTATASRDLKKAVEEEYLLKEGSKATTVYRFQ
jgi:CDP-alcohol phosphatidyltransferase-like enzyme